MNARELLLAQTRHRHAALSAATDVPEDVARWTPAPGRPSIAWIVAHLEHDAAETARALGGAAWESAGDAGEWDALRARWLDTSRRTLELLEATTDADLELPPAIEILPEFRQMLATRGQFWSGHVFHVAYHLGQVGSVRAAHGLPWW